MARQLGSVARYEVDHMIERQRAAKLQAGQAGRYRGGPRPFGFESDGVTVRPSEAAAVLDASQRVLRGETLGSIAREWTARGLLTSGQKPWTSIALHRVLIRPRNAAIITHEGRELAEAVWPAIVPPDVWRGVCELLSDPARRRPRSADRVWLGSGLFLCGKCLDGKTTMRSAVTMGGANGPRRPAYRCRAGAHLARVAAPVDKFITGVVLAWLKLPGVESLLRAAPGVDTEALSAESAALRLRLDELASLFAGGEVTGRQLAEGSAKIRQRLADLEVQLATAVAGSPLEGLADADDVDAAWQAMSVSRKKAVISELMTVTLLPAPRGRRPGGGYFDPGSVLVEWRR